MNRPSPITKLIFAALSLALLGGASLTAQVAKPLPMDEEGKRLRERATKMLGLEATGGVLVPNYRRLTSSSLDDLKWRPNPGLFAGINLVLAPYNEVSLLLGFEYVRESGAFTDYTVGDPLGQRTFRDGDIEVTDNFFRATLQLRARVKHFALLVGGQISSNIGNAYDYSYVQSARFRLDPETGETVPLPEPITSTGVQEQSFRGGGYAGILFGAGYPVNERLLIRARYDLGIHTIFGLNRLDRHVRHRIDVGADYLLFTE